MSQKKDAAPNAVSPEQERQEKLDNFNKELVELQNNYRLRIMAQVQFPGGASLNVPLTVVDFPDGVGEEVKSEDSQDQPIKPAD